MQRIAYTTKEVAKMLNISNYVVRKMIRRNEIRSVQYDRLIFISAESIADYLDQDFIFVKKNRYKIEEVVKMLGISRMSLYKLIKNHAIEIVRQLRKRKSARIYKCQKGKYNRSKIYITHASIEKFLNIKKKRGDKNEIQKTCTNEYSIIDDAECISCSRE